MQSKPKVQIIRKDAFFFMEGNLERIITNGRVKKYIVTFSYYKREDYEPLNYFSILINLLASKYKRVGFDSEPYVHI